MIYTLSFLGPIVAHVCFYNFVENQGDFCAIDPPKLSVVKYYEPGKSCYVNGIFYTKCEESNGTFTTNP